MLLHHVPSTWPANAENVSFSDFDHIAIGSRQYPDYTLFSRGVSGVLTLKPLYDMLKESPAIGQRMIITHIARLGHLLMLCMPPTNFML